ncbi:hypothetical protein [Nocardia sp. bgisy118]|uniref:hypothetical protein n=1 Tax=Nocardia sp. bgisy118 TaxID=3413786 RepID=UPI003F49F2F8
MEELDGYELCCGCLDFLTIRLGRELIADNILDSYSQTAVEFAPLFDGLWLDEAVQEQFDATLINDVVVVLDAQLALPLRGRQLGAWMLSEVAGRMLSSHDGLVVARPIPDDTDPNTHAGRMATERLTQHWRSCGLVPVTGHQEFLAQASAYTALGSARAALDRIADRDITLTADQMARWTEPFGSHD